jgi:ABC-2 type transport system ATP-binding protein
MRTAISVRGLTRHYGGVMAIDGISFEVGRGEVFGLLGPNGAGKTTTLECILGLGRPDQGEIAVLGQDVISNPRAVKAKTGAVLQATGLQDKITAREALNLFRSFYPTPLATDDLLKRFGLWDKQNAAYDTLSGGQKQRLALALAFG